MALREDVCLYTPWLRLATDVYTEATLPLKAIIASLIDSSLDGMSYYWNRGITLSKNGCTFAHLVVDVTSPICNIQ